MNLECYRWLGYVCDILYLTLSLLKMGLIVTTLTIIVVIN